MKFISSLLAAAALFAGVSSALADSHYAVDIVGTFTVQVTGSTVKTTPLNNKSIIKAYVAASGGSEKDFDIVFTFNEGIDIINKTTLPPSSVFVIAAAGPNYSTNGVTDIDKKKKARQLFTGYGVSVNLPGVNGPGDTTNATMRDIYMTDGSSFDPLSGSGISFAGQNGGGIGSNFVTGFVKKAKATYTY